jgi:hypothetical protein
MPIPQEKANIAKREEILLQHCRILHYTLKNNPDRETLVRVLDQWKSGCEEWLRSRGEIP